MKILFEQNNSKAINYASMEVVMYRYSNKDLGYLNDQTLGEYYMELRSKLIKSSRKRLDDESSKNMRDLEVHLCYVTRELQNREKRAFYDKQFNAQRKSI